ncbi:hypothetical protein MMC13_000349, partial [Lambiella insularis]|nr:hypothetical protein [Lambiella insularis]
MFEFCQQRRKLERRGMERATEIIERKKIEKEKQLEKTRAERRQRKEEVGQAREEAEKTKKRWWNSQGNG